MLPEEYAETIWQMLDEQDKYQFLYVQMEVFSLDEIAEKFGELGGVYEQFSSKTRHKYSLYKTEFNEALCRKLVKMEFLSFSEIIEEKVGKDSIMSQDKYEKLITGNVKRGQRNNRRVDSPHFQKKSRICSRYFEDNTSRWVLL